MGTPPLPPAHVWTLGRRAAASSSPQGYNVNKWRTGFFHLSHVWTSWKGKWFYLLLTGCFRAPLMPRFLLRFLFAF